jgi:formylglycine-generating enzyme required for sulfatase activity
VLNLLRVTVPIVVLAALATTVALTSARVRTQREAARVHQAALIELESLRGQAISAQRTADEKLTRGRRLPSYDQGKQQLDEAEIATGEDRLDRARARFLEAARWFRQAGDEAQELKELATAEADWQAARGAADEQALRKFAAPQFQAAQEKAKTAKSMAATGTAAEVAASYREAVVTLTRASIDAKSVAQAEGDWRTAFAAADTLVLKKYAAVQFEAAQRWAESAHTQVKIGATTEALNLYRDAVVTLERATIEARSKQQYERTREFQVEWERTTNEWDPTSAEAKSVAEPPAQENVAGNKPVGPAEVLTNSIGMKFVLIPAGEFLMGSPESSRDAGKADSLQRPIKISQPFLLGAYEVTQEEFGKVMVAGTGTRMWYPSRFKESGRSAPVENFDGRYAEEFCKWLSALPAEQEAGRRYRLPTEAEWEYACRAGSTSQYCFGDDAQQLADYAWFGGNSGEKTHPVGAKKPNAWGLYDMYGNVAEWCSGVAAASWVLRGGSFKEGAEGCRSASRRELFLGFRGITLGFRVAGDLSLGHYQKRLQAEKAPGAFAKPQEPPAEKNNQQNVPGNKPDGPAEVLTNSIGMKLVLIRAAGSPPDDPKGPASGSDRVYRGGGWSGRPGGCRSSNRDWLSPEGRSNRLGFRVARSSSGE